MKKVYIILIISLFFVAVFALAQEEIEKIEYPIEELGNCQNREDCTNFCDKIVNLEACFNFSRENKLPTRCDLADSRKFLDALKQGVKILPCESKAECLDYCSKPENLSRCLAFAQKTGILSRYEVLLFKRTGGLGPGNCKSKEECKEYCSKEENVDECLAFAQNNGFMSQGEVAEAIRLRDIALAGGPGGCVGLEQCKEYCSVSSNFQECIDFGKEAGIITSEEIEEIQEFIQEGGPGGCKTRQECDKYCSEPENIKFCLEYMVDKNYLPKESVQAIENTIKETEESINQQIEEFKKNFNLEGIEDEEIRKEIQEKLQPYKDILNIK